MVKRIGLVAIVVDDRASVSRVNAIISDFADLVEARMGLPMRARGLAVISLVVEGTTDGIGALCGRLGKVPGVRVKSVLTAIREDGHGNEDKGLHRQDALV